MLWTKHGATERTLSPAPLWAQILVIGYGNSLRRDDGAGIALAEKLAAHWEASYFPVRLLTNMQLLPEMAEEVANHDIEAVIFVDTTPSTTNAAQIAVSEVNLDAASPSTGHQLEPATLLIYAALLYGHLPQAWLVTIPGSDFDHGEGFSPQVNELLDTSATVADQLLVRIQEAIPCMS